VKKSRITKATDYDTEREEYSGKERIKEILKNNNSYPPALMTLK